MAGSTAGPHGERWGSTLNLVNRFYLPLREQDGVPEDRIAAAEQRLGVELPGALREWYRLAGGRGDYMGNQDQLLGPDQLRWSEDAPDVLVFSVETCCCCEWGIRRTELDQDDPPVVEVNPDREEEEDEEDEAPVYPQAGSVSGFFAWMVHEGLFLSGPINNGVASYVGPVSTGVPAAILRAFREHYPALPGPQGLPGDEVRGDDDTLLRLRNEDGRTTVDVALRTAAAAETLCARTGFPADELQHTSRYWAHRFGPGCRDVAPGYILRQPFPPGIEVDLDALMQAPYCHADAGGPSSTTRKLDPGDTG